MAIENSAFIWVYCALSYFQELSTRKYTIVRKFVGRNRVEARIVWDGGKDETCIDNRFYTTRGYNGTAIASELFGKLRKRLLVNKFSEINIGDFPKETVDGGISLMSLLRNLVL